VAIFSLLAIQPLSALAAGVLSGFVHNCPAAAAFVKSLPNFGWLRSKLISLLSNTDHNVVIASMSSLSSLFNVGDDSETLIRLALRAIAEPPSLPLATALSVWTILDLIPLVPLEVRDYLQIIDALIHSEGMRALQLFVLLTELHRMGIDLFRMIKANSLFSPLFRVTLRSSFDFVTAAGAQYLSAVLESHRLPSLTDLPEIFTVAVDIIVMSDPSASLLRLESVLLLLRIFIHAKHKDALLAILSDQQHKLFIGFQRHIEGGHSFISVNFFLLLVDCLSFIPDWNSFILHTIAETQFCSLLVHVLTHSKNRTVLQDACTAVQLIVNGLSDRKGSPLIESLVSGFLVVNSMTAVEKARMVDHYETKKIALTHRIEEIENDKVNLGREFAQLTEAKQELDSVAMDTAKEVGASREHIIHLREKLRKKSKKYRVAAEELRALGEEIAQLKVEVQHRDQNIQELTETTAQLKTELREFANLNGQFREMKVKVEAREREIVQLRESLEHIQKVAEANGITAENELKGRRQAEAKLYEISGQLSELSVKVHDQEMASETAQKQKQKFENEAKKRGERLTATEQSNRTLRARITELEDDLRTLTKFTRAQKQEISILQQKITVLETQCHDHTTLYQFIHKITEHPSTSIDKSEE
jgi:hypothetical protein